MPTNEFKEIISKLKFADVEVRMQAMNRLLQYRDPGILDVLLDVATSDEDYQVAYEARKALHELGTQPEFKIPLLNTLAGSTPLIQKEIVAEVLRNHKDLQVVNALITVYEQYPDNFHFREVVAWSLANFDLVRAKTYFSQEKINIIVAEDEPDIRELICFTLRFSGWTVMGTSNGEGAYACTKIFEPDLVLLDVRMPRMTGYDACRLIKKDADVQHIPVVFLSAKGQDGEIETGLAAGAEEYLLKPFAPDQLTERIKSILAKYELGIYKEQSMNKPDDKSDIDFLVQEVKQLRKERIDLLRRLSQTQEQSDKTSNGQFPLAELSRITNGIVHDMRNGMGIIRNTVGFMSDDLANTPHEKDIRKISRSLDFCEVVLRNLSALGGQDILNPQQVNLETVIREIFFMLENKLVDIKLVIDSGGEQPVILADEGHMKQVFMNLIKNAGEAMSDGGTLTCRFHKEGDMMRIEIQDTGHGISEENQQRLFREFFTTKERGYGIGLFIVHTIVQRHGGEISVKSKNGEGTVFTLLMPVEVK